MLPVLFWVGDLPVYSHGFFPLLGLLFAQEAPSPPSLT
jgi:hypothetical protein